MAQVPSGQKFHTVPSNVQTEEKGSKLANSQREIYTMQDIVDTVENALPPSAPQILIGSINQLGTNVPELYEIYSDFSPLSIVRNGVGYYTFVFQAGLLNEKTIATISINGSAPFPNGGILGIWVEPSNNTLYIKTMTPAGVESDNILSGSRLQIQIYE
jgi:hypothetical protein